MRSFPESEHHTKCRPQDTVAVTPNNADSDNDLFTRPGIATCMTAFETIVHETATAN